MVIGLLAVATLFAITSLTNRSDNAAAVSAVNWVTNYDAALKTAAQTNRPILLAFKAGWCGPCKWMDREVFSKPAVGKALSTWVPVHVDIDSQSRLARQYDITGVPTFVMLSSAGKELGRTSGAMSVEEFALFLASASPASAPAPSASSRSPHHQPRESPVSFLAIVEAVVGRL